MKKTFVCVAMLCLALTGVAQAVNVDMDPVPRFPLRKGDDLTFLVQLSGAAKACKVTVTFENLPAGIKAEPAEQSAGLKPGEEKLLVFKVACTEWGPDAVVRPTVTADGGEPVNFPDRLKTTLVRDAKQLDKKPLDEKGLLAYYSCGDSGKRRPVFDRSVGRAKFWDEGVWYSAGGVKGRAVFGMNALPYPRHRWSKMAYETLNNIYYRRGTITFWIRRGRRASEIPYAGRFKGDPKTTWKIGPNAMRGHEGEGIFGYVWSPQAIYTRWFLKAKRPWKPFKPGSDCFIGMRRYKAVKGLTDGYLEVTYKAMRGKIYHIQAAYPWTRDWRHVAVTWDANAAKLQIHLDGTLASGPVMLNGQPSADKVFHAAPWHVATFCNAAMSICCVSAEGGRGATDRDELYVYNRALSPDEIKANMKKSMGQVPMPILTARGASFHGWLDVWIRSPWYNVTHRYTTDGTEPTENSPSLPVGERVLTFHKTVTLKVKSFLKGFDASETATTTFKSLGPDKDPPRITKVSAVNDPKAVMVCFDELVSRGAEKVAKYAVDGTAPTAAKLDNDGRTVRLTLAKPLTGTHTLTVKDVRDRAEPGNRMAETKVAFKFLSLSGLTGWWSFDCLDGPVVKDLSPSKIDGIGWSDNVQQLTRIKGVRGKGVQLDGIDDLVDVTDYLDATRRRVNPKSPHTTDQGTAAIWFKVDPKTLGWRKALFNKTYSFELYLASGKLMRSKLDVNDGKWHHAAYVYQAGKGAGITIYLDGKPVIKQKKRFLNHRANGVGLGVGGGGYGQPKHFGGALDEFMLFNRPLTAEEVQSLYKTGGFGR
jgi:concanavalin A-like lectin/glucanase superfamily protein/chitobiase/beta-hexosaminidase-like protein